jgi:hypothetical protein
MLQKDGVAFIGDGRSTVVRFTRDAQYAWAHRAQFSAVGLLSTGCFGGSAVDKP